MKNFCTTVLKRASVYFTVATMLFSIFVLLSNSGSESYSLAPERVLFFFPFSIFFAIANTTVRSKKIEAATRWIIHALLTVAGAYLFLILPAKLDTGAGNFMGLALIVFSYLIGILLYALINLRVRSAIAEDKELVRNNKKK